MRNLKKNPQESLLTELQVINKLHRDRIVTGTQFYRAFHTYRAKHIRLRLNKLLNQNVIRTQKAILPGHKKPTTYYFLNI